MCCFKEFLDRYRKNPCSGIVYIFFGLVAFPFVLLVLYVEELALSDLYRARISYALNAAAIAGARYNIDDAVANAQDIFIANLTDTLSGLPDDVTLEITSSPSTLHAQATYTMSHKLLNLLGNSWVITDEVTLQRYVGGLEIAAVLNLSDGTNVSTYVSDLFSYFFNNANQDNIFGGIVPCCNENDALMLSNNPVTIDGFLDNIPNQTELLFSGIDIAHTKILDPTTPLAPPVPKNYDIERNTKFILLVSTNPNVDPNFLTHCAAAKSAGINIAIASAGNWTVPEYDTCASKAEWHKHVDAITDLPLALERLREEMLPIYIVPYVN